MIMWGTRSDAYMIVEVSTMPSFRSVRSGLAALAGAALLLAGAALPTLACTNLKFETATGGVIRGRTMELEGDMKSQMMITPKGTELTGYDANGKLDGMTWTAKHTVAGLNAYGLNIYVDGINDAGLSGGALMFPEFCEFQTPDPAKLDRTIAGEQVVSYVLTSFATVEEVKAGLPDVLVVDSLIPSAPTAFPLHFIFTDPTGASVVAEYVGGELKLHDAPLGVLTNAPTYDFHITNLANYANLSVNSVPVRDIGTVKFAPLSTGGSLVGMPGDFTSISRFIRATVYSQALQKPATADRCSRAST